MAQFGSTPGGKVDDALRWYLKAAAGYRTPRLRNQAFDAAVQRFGLNGNERAELLARIQRPRFG